MQVTKKKYADKIILLRNIQKEGDEIILPWVADSF